MKIRKIRFLSEKCLEIEQEKEKLLELLEPIEKQLDVKLQFSQFRSICENRILHKFLISSPYISSSMPEYSRLLL